ncbi:MAG: ribosome biogenesis GTP-binding protein YihA/YsxC [Spirochaetes bacterium]|nr:ribosome biogenesis GTP-binding protein YihA/YsxC [Spirochaetota bacterium]
MIFETGSDKIGEKLYESVSKKNSRAVTNNLTNIWIGSLSGRGLNNKALPDKRQIPKDDTMKITDVYFVKSAAAVSGFPENECSEFAFFGRSNVGKSSFINMLVGRKSIVKVGGRPGVTQLINFFMLNKDISLVDMPGFGYAKLPANIKKKFLPLIIKYIKNRDNLRLAFLLVDVRRTPGEMEKDIISTLTEKGVPIAIIATKCDKLSKNTLRKNAAVIAEALQIGTDSIFFTSAKTGQGKDEILDLIEEYIK